MMTSQSRKESENVKSFELDTGSTFQVLGRFTENEMGTFNLVAVTCKKNWKKKKLCSSFNTDEL